MTAFQKSTPTAAFCALCGMLRNAIFFNGRVGCACPMNQAAANRQEQIAKTRSLARGYEEELSDLRERLREKEAKTTGGSN